MSEEVNSHDAQVLHHGGGTDNFCRRVVHNNTVAGVVVAAGCVVNLVGNVESNLRLTVVVGGWIQNRPCYFVSKLKVGVFDGDTGRASDGIVDGKLFNGVGQRCCRGGVDGDLRVPTTGRRGWDDAVRIGRVVGFQKPVNRESCWVDDPVPNAATNRWAIPIKSEVHPGGVPFRDLVRIVATRVLRCNAFLTWGFVFDDLPRIVFVFL